MADWTRLENDLIVADYFSMLSDELADKPINKTKNRRALLSLLKNRSNSAIEWKHRNISAILSEIGVPFIKGYKEAPHKQESLVDAILDYLKLRKDEMQVKFEKFSDRQITSKPIVPDFIHFIDSAPVKKGISEPIVPFNRKPFKINYLEREQMNLALGERGEELVIQFEKWHFIQSGRPQFANQIEWISKTDDSAGFDILSKNLDGTDKYIEVKTTKLNKDTPFFFSKSEYYLSKAKTKNYHLYRVFHLDSLPKMFQVAGCFDDFCNKEASIYKGTF
jgi:hypothetical protein